MGTPKWLVYNLTFYANVWQHDLGVYHHFRKPPFQDHDFPWIIFAKFPRKISGYVPPKSSRHCTCLGHSTRTYFTSLTSEDVVSQELKIDVPAMETKCWSATLLDTRIRGIYIYTVYIYSIYILYGNGLLETWTSFLLACVWVCHGVSGNGCPQNIFSIQIALCQSLHDQMHMTSPYWGLFWMVGA